MMTLNNLSKDVDEKERQVTLNKLGKEDRRNEW